MNDQEQQPNLEPVQESQTSAENSHVSAQPPPQRQLMAYERFFSGPLPPPETLAGYEKIQVGLADRIVRMAENQSTHRQKLESLVVESNVRLEKIGIIIGTSLTILAMLLGVVLIVLKTDNFSGYITLLGTLGYQGYNHYIQQKSADQPKTQEKRKNKKNPRSKQ